VVFDHKESAQHLECGSHRIYLEGETFTTIILGEGFERIFGNPFESSTIKKIKVHCGANFQNLKPQKPEKIYTVDLGKRYRSLDQPEEKRVILGVWLSREVGCVDARNPEAQNHEILKS
jgi:hypothetical protein